MLYPPIGIVRPPLFDSTRSKRKWEATQIEAGPEPHWSRGDNEWFFARNNPLIRERLEDCWVLRILIQVF